MAKLPTAEQARAWSTESTRTADITRQLVEHVSQRIKRAASRGRTELHNPLARPVDLWTANITPAHERAVRVQLEAAGYTWTHHPAFPGEDPREGAYDTISWSLPETNTPRGERE